MRVLHVISSLTRAGGGPSRSSQGLVAGLNSVGIETWLLAINPSEEPWIKGVDHFVNAKPFEEVALDVKPDIVHLHGLWNLDIHRCAAVCRRRKIPYVIAPRGMLEPWSLKQKWLKKRIARFLYQDKDLKCAAALHATAESEAEQFRRLGFKNKIIVSPNGVNVPASLPTPTPSTYTSNKARRALFVSRMHPKKGVLELVESWARVKPEGWCCELVYTMNSAEERAYEQRVKDRILALGMSYQDKDGTIHSTTTTSNYDFILTGPLDDEKKWEAYARADLFVLPTYSENFGIVVAEALWAGVPVITTKGTPWKELEEHKCGWWIDLPPTEAKVKGVGVEWSALVSALKEALSFRCTSTPITYPSLARMGENGRALVEECYTWDAVCDKMVRGYEETLSK